MDKRQVKKSSKPRCGVVAIVGRPNVGKSTLLNKILGEKVAIVSRVPQTTRHQIRGIYTDERGQIIFIDTPGYYLGKDKLDRCLQKTSVHTMQEADCIIHLVDTSRKIGQEEEGVTGRLKSLKIPIILGLNKVDLKNKYFPSYIELWEKAKGKPIQDLKNVTLISLSGKQGTNVEDLIDVLFEKLPAGVPLYPEDTICDVPQKMAIADIIREKLFVLLRQEIPHSLSVIVESVQPRRKKALYINATIIVERDTQKEIVIGKKAQFLKKAGTRARHDLEELLDSKIFLDLQVKTKKSWRDDQSFLQEVGYFPL